MEFPFQYMGQEHTKGFDHVASQGYAPGQGLEQNEQGTKELIVDVDGELELGQPFHSFILLNSMWSWFMQILEFRHKKV